MLHLLGQRGRDGQRRPGLADARDIVLLALDREDRHVADRRRIHLAPAMRHRTPGQRMRLEHRVDRLEVEFRGHVADRAILLVELHRRLGALVVALDEMLEHLPVRDHVVAEVHRHEARELQEARIDLPPRAGIAHRHGRDDVLLEPAERPLGGERVHRGRRFARVDRAAHHGERRRAVRMRVGAHHRHRGIGRYRGLAHRQHVRPRIAVLADKGEELDQIIDIVVEVEAAGRQRHQLRVAPVGDVDVRHRQHPLDRAAQQRGIMAGHRRDDQQLGAALHARAIFGGAHEALELAERLAQHHFLMDGDLPAVDHRAIEPEFRLAARRGGMREHLERRGKHRPAAEIGERIGGVVQQTGGKIGQRARTCEKRALNLISVVQHCVPSAVPLPKNGGGYVSVIGEPCCGATPGEAVMRRNDAPRPYRNHEIPADIRLTPSVCTTNWPFRNSCGYPAAPSRQRTVPLSLQSR